jgi:hypothetical protein
VVGEGVNLGKGVLRRKLLGAKSTTSVGSAEAQPTTLTYVGHSPKECSEVAISMAV